MKLSSLIKAQDDTRVVYEHHKDYEWIVGKNGKLSPPMYAGEGIPEELGRGSDKYIEKVGTQFCIRSNGVDQNFGCWPDKAKAESVMRGESFITPDVPKNLLAKKAGKPKGHDSKPHHPGIAGPDGVNHRMRQPESFKLEAGGPGSGRHKEAQKEFDRIYKLAKQAGLKDTKAHEIATKAFADKLQRMYAGGPGSGRKSSTAKGLNKWKSWEDEIKQAAKDPKQRKLPLKAKKIEAHDWGEPNAGAYQHAHLDTNLFFHPPSERNPKRIPTDDPGEKDDRFLDVTKRKQAHKQRMDLLKKSAPGGTPPNVPVRTTLISPTLNSYLPMHASAARKRRRAGGGMFRAYGSAKI